MALDYTVIGNRIRQARLDKKFTQEYLAEQLDLSITYLSRIERGKINMSLNRLSQICNFLDVSEGYILTGSSSDSSTYLNKEFSDLLKKCPAHKQRLIYKIATIIFESDY